jgi:hypothetical protein
MRVPFCTGSKEKRQVTKYQEPKIIHEKKLLLYIEDDMWVPFCNSGLIVSRRHRIKRKRK